MGHNKKKRRPSPPAASVQSSAAPMALLWICLGALVLRLLHLYIYRDDFWLRTPLLDDNIFVSWADLIGKEGWMARSLGMFDLNPAYPYLLAFARLCIGKSWAAMFALQHLVGALAPALVFRATDRALGRRSAYAAAILAALYGPAVFYESRFLGEIWIYLFNGAVLACLLSATDTKKPLLWWGGAGLCLGLSTVFRPNVLPFAAVAVVWAVVHFRTQRSILLGALGLFLLGLWLPLLPFQLRNHSVAPERGWGLTTSSGGVNLYLGNNPEADGLNQAPAFIRYGPGHEYQDFKEEAERRTGRSMETSEVSSYWSAQVLQWYRRQPAAAAKLLIRKAGFFWNHDEPPDNFFPSIFKKFTKLGPVPLIGWGFVAPLGLAGLLWSLRRPEHRAGWVLHGYVTVYFAVNVAFYILSRYRFPAAIALMPFAGFALVRVYDDMRSGSRMRAGKLLALIILCGGLSQLRLIGEEDMAVSHYSMGVIYANQGWKDEAAVEYQKSIQANPRFKASYLNLGILEAQRGNRAGAINALTGAYQLEPDPRRRELLQQNIKRLSAAP
jgi:4-amino-4-deoxy-L-arabinose transferase-like glycosyltransferase